MQQRHAVLFLFYCVSFVFYGKYFGCSDETFKKSSTICQPSLHACAGFTVCKHNFPFPGVGAASSGKLTFMVGGAEEEFTAAKELLSCMGVNVVYCGQVGTGQV